MQKPEHLSIQNAIIVIKYLYENYPYMENTHEKLFQNCHQICFILCGESRL